MPTIGRLNPTDVYGLCACRLNPTFRIQDSCHFFQTVKEIRDRIIEIMLEKENGCRSIQCKINRMLKSNEGLHTTRARLPWASVGFKRPMVGACQHEGLHTTRAH